MISTTGGHNNWWTVNLDIKLKPKPSTFTIDFNLTKPVKKLSFQDAVDYNVECINKQYKNLYLAMSGGLDSEFVATALFRNNVKFEPVIGHIKNSRNLDFQYALDWCHQHKINPTVLEFELDDPKLLKSTVNFAKNFKLEKLRFPVLITVLDYIDQQGGNALTGDPSIGYTDLDENFYQGIGDKFEVWWVEMISSIFKPNHPGAFFFHTPELVYAQARELDVTLSDSRSRAKLYQLPFRPKTWPPLALTDETRFKINQICEVDKYSDPAHYGWTKQDLLKSFSG